MVNIVTRKQWGAKPPTSAFYKPGSLHPARELWLHHFANNNWNGALGMRQCQAYHQNTRKYKDIAYSHCVDDDGSIFEGRGFGVAGGHTKGHNTISYGVAGMNNFSVNKPTDRFINAVVDLVEYSHEQGYYPIDFSGGHRDVGSTACPGNYLYPKIPLINELTQKGKRVEPGEYDYAIAVIYDSVRSRFDEGLAHALGQRFTFAVLPHDHSARVGFGIPIGWAAKTIRRYPEGHHAIAGATGPQTAGRVLQYIMGEKGEPKRRGKAW